MTRAINRRTFGAGAIAGFAAGPLATLPSFAQAAGFPERDITFVVSFGPGGVTDIMSRALARGMEESLGKTIIVTNRPGALGTLGPAYLTKQRPDGYTIGSVSASATTLTPHLMNVPFTSADLEFIAGYGISTYGLVVRADSKYRTLDDLLKASKDKSMMFGSPSTPNSLLMQHLGKLSSSKFELVTYKSGPETANALLGSQVELIVANPPDVVPNIKAGRLRLLASASSARWPDFPDVPTLKEQGFEVGYDAWVGLAAPAKTPAAIIARLQESVEKATVNPAIRKIYQDAGTQPGFMGAKDYTEHLEKERNAMDQLIKLVGLPRIS